MNLKQRSISNCWCCTLVHSSGQPSKWIPKQVCHASPLKSKRVNKETSLSQTVQLLLPYSQPVFTCPTVSIPFPTVSMSSPALQSVCLSLPYSPLPYSQYVFPCPTVSMSFPAFQSPAPRSVWLPLPYSQYGFPAFQSPALQSVRLSCLTVPCPTVSMSSPASAYKGDATQSTHMTATSVSEIHFGTCSPAPWIFYSLLRLVRTIYIHGVLYIQHFWQRIHQIYGHIRCIYSVLANSNL